MFKYTDRVKPVHHSYINLLFYTLLKKELGKHLYESLPFILYQRTIVFIVVDYCEISLNNIFSKCHNMDYISLCVSIIVWVVQVLFLTGGFRTLVYYYCYLYLKQKIIPHIRYVFFASKCT